MQQSMCPETQDDMGHINSTTTPAMPAKQIDWIRGLRLAAPPVPYPWQVVVLAWPHGSSPHGCPEATGPFYLQGCVHTSINP